jgi:cell division protein FtsI/penicillin-binding protein 2
MKLHKLLLVLIVIALTAAACQTGPGVSSDATPTAGLPTPHLSVNTAPDVEASAAAYLEAWKAEDYESMYAQLSVLTREALSLEDFIAQHKATAVNLTMTAMDYSILSKMINPATAQVSYEIRYETALLDTITRTTLMNLILEDGTWHVQWEAGMMLPELAGGNYLEKVLEVPARGNIYSSSGYPLVAQADAVSIRVIPGQIDPDTEDGMVTLLADLTGQTEEQVRAKYENTPADQYAIIGDITAETANENSGELGRYDGITLMDFRSRYYYDGGIAPHVTGYVLSISPEELEKYQRMGYSGDEKVGATGLEAWGESYLAGTHGIDVYVKDPQGQILTRLGSSAAVPAASIYTTIDSALQYDLQRSFGDNVGAIVVLERDSGKVIAMASKPGFDPNVFNAMIYSSYSIAEVTQDPLNPLYNRAAQGVYPPGSVFKIITMAAALETGVFTPDYPYMCDSLWTEMPGWTGKDWTYDKGYASSGLLTLQQGLMRSCNPWFWHIAYTLWNQGYQTAIPDLALGFGLGKITGIEIPDFNGRVEYPTTVNDYVQMAIGQSTLQVSPLQVASFVAAVGNGGTLYRPTVVDHVARLDGEPLYSFEPEAIGKLPVTEDNLKAIQEAMVMVVRNPSGTATYQFRSVSANIAGKTGTAENPLGNTHAWFAGYTFNEDPNRPDIAVAIVLENAGEGSEMAAPLFRRVVSLYFSNGSNPGGTMPWEEDPYVPATPEPSETP